LSLATLIVFGSNVWLDFIDATRHASSGGAAAEMYARVYIYMATLLAAAKMPGWSTQLAMACNSRDPGSRSAPWFGPLLAIRRVTSRTAILVTATFLVSP
jgi:hypothetical protein